jgi:hypothetical protein
LGRGADTDYHLHTHANSYPGDRNTVGHTCGNPCGRADGEGRRCPCARRPDHQPDAIHPAGAVATAKHHPSVSTDSANTGPRPYLLVLRGADNQGGMNGLGVGLSVALGTGIGARLAVPDLYPAELLVSMLVYGMIFGYIFHLYQWALRGVRLPFRRR